MQTADLITLGQQAQDAASILAQLDNAAKNRGLMAMADALIAQTPAILAANAQDVKAAANSKFLDRLTLTEARPNVTADAAGLTLKSGNAVILRGGKEALRSNMAVVKVLQAALKSVDLPALAVQLVEDPSHEIANQMMHLNQYIDVLIPRGVSWRRRWDMVW